jgi:protein-tyrosine phosphatase
MAEAAGLDDVIIESFGTSAGHRGEPADPRAMEALSRRGWRTGTHRARQLDVAVLRAANLVLCADHANLAAVRRLAGRMHDVGEICLLRRFDPDASSDDDEVPDPWAGSARDFDRALELIERSCGGLIAALGTAENDGAGEPVVTRRPR